MIDAELDPNGSEEVHPEPVAALPVVEVWSESAASMLVVAEARAVDDGSGVVCAHHLLLAMSEAPASAAGSILAGLGITPVSLLERMQFIAASQPSGAVPDGPIQRSPRLQRTLEFASREAGRRGAEAASSLDLLAALVRGRDGVAAFLLALPGSGYRPLDEALRAAAKERLNDPS